MAVLKARYTRSGIFNTDLVTIEHESAYWRFEFRRRWKASSQRGPGLPRLNVEDMTSRELYCLGTTQNDSPRHPLYVTRRSTKPLLSNWTPRSDMTRFAESTTVSADKSRSEIEKTLQRYGVVGVCDEHR